MVRTKTVQIASIGTILLWAILGCARTRPAEPGPRLVRGDWDDALPAARVAASAAEMAILQVAAPAEFEVRLELIAIGDAAGSATIRRIDGSTLEVTCRVGRFGDSRREDRFLDALERRLAQLAGVDFAPVR